MTDADVIIAGAGPTGLMLAAELRLAGVRPLVLEKHAQPRETQKAMGLGGQILHLLRYRGLLERCEAATTDPIPPARFPFGGIHVDLTQLTDSPLEGLPLPQTRLERILDEYVGELGADVRRGHEVVGVDQDEAAATVQVHGPDGPYRATARYLVACDGGRSPVRDMAGIPFPGTTYPEINRLAVVTAHESVTVLDNGEIDIPGMGRIGTGFIRSERGVFGFGSVTSGVLMFSVTEDESTEFDDATPMTLTEFQDSVRRVLGSDIPLGDPLRLTRFTFKDRHVERYRDGRVLIAGDAAHLLPSTGVGLNAGMLDAVNLAWKLAGEIQGWAPPGLLDSYHAERHFAGSRALLQTRAQVALRRSLDPAADALRQVFQELLADEQPARRIGAMISGADIRYPLPGADRHPLIGAFAPDLALRTEEGFTSVAELMHAARPVFLNLADRPELRAVVREWEGRIDIVSAETEHPTADAVLIRPDAHIAWAVTADEPVETALVTLRDALSSWFGAPSKATVLAADRIG
ncbi:FAD-dependent monooxygenase [Nocardia sp. NBC_00416]|uniref:FAD-dependent monooxygenase n=1 Tax=Nocardia sp. NBC_00416 TaxID=2975991 RepID=UPI002E1CF557